MFNININIRVLTQHGRVWLQFFSGLDKSLDFLPCLDVYILCRHPLFGLSLCISALPCSHTSFLHGALTFYSALFLLSFFSWCPLLLSFLLMFSFHSALFLIPPLFLSSVFSCFLLLLSILVFIHFVIVFNFTVWIVQFRTNSVSLSNIYYTVLIMSTQDGSIWDLLGPKNKIP